MATLTTTTTADEKVAADDEYVEARQENGRFINSFNTHFKLPGFATIARWALGEPNNTNLPRNLKDLDETLPVISHNKGEFFTEKTGLRFIWVGHATCLVQMDDFIFITDPLFGERCGVTTRLGPKRFRPPALTVDQLPDNLSAVVISHNHFDHLDYPSVQALHQRYGKSLTWFCGLGLRQWFVDAGIENAVELTWWQDTSHPVSRRKTSLRPFDALLSSFRLILMFRSPFVLLNIGKTKYALVLRVSSISIL